MSTEKTELNNLNRELQKVPIAIIGMASIFPKARTLQEYWSNIIHQVDCICDVPPTRWNVEEYYDPNPFTPDKTYCKRGGFIPDIDFNPMEFGLPPNMLEATDVSQLLGLIVAREALEDAGYGLDRPWDRTRAGVILGVALGRQLGVDLGARLQYPVWKRVLTSSGLSEADSDALIEKMKLAYVHWDEDAFPGMLANIVAGRIANRFDLGGMNCVVDAACASSLGALSLAMSELVSYRSDLMLTGGVDTDNSEVAFLCFSKTPALSLKQQTRPFDVESDGMLLGEGVGMLVLKRLTDAERDQDRIYAIIRGIGSSSDGRYKSIYAPRASGQILALQRAYEDAGVAPQTIGLIEAHGTGTLAGDRTEMAALKEAFRTDDGRTQYIAVGSVKSQIGHTKAAAGAASLIKVALALHHKILPPTLNITEPSPKLELETSAFYLNTTTRPWLTEGETPRRAGVSSFGFGGTNYHVVLEEYEREHHQPYRLQPTPQTVLLWADTPEQLLTRVQDLFNQLHAKDAEHHFVRLSADTARSTPPRPAARLGFVASTLAQARKFLTFALDNLHSNPAAEQWSHPLGVFYRRQGLDPEAKVVALFAGQGSQYLEMGRELALNFPELRQVYTRMDSLMTQDGLRPISEVVFPPQAFTPADQTSQREALQRTEYAQPAIGVFSLGLYTLLRRAGFTPDFVAGHSFGEMTALWAAGVLSEEDYLFLVKARGRAMATPGGTDAGAMLAVQGNGRGVSEDLIRDFPQLTVANVNSSEQVVLAGPSPAIAEARQALQSQGYSAVLLPVAAAFHTPLVSYSQKPFVQALAEVTIRPAQVPVYSNASGESYPEDAPGIQSVLEQHLLQPVRFKQELERMYAAGGRCFVEFGPRNILTNLVKETLKDQPHLALAVNASRQKDSDRQLREAIVQLRVAGLPLTDLDPYARPSQFSKPPKHPALTVSLSSTNYVSEKTKMAFEKALQNGPRIPTNPPIAEPPPSMANPSPANPLAPAANSVPSQSPQPADAAPAPQRLLESLEHSLALFNQHQSDLLQVHGQYLDQHREYIKTSFDLLQQQTSLSGTAPQRVVMEGLERSMMRFHDHQAATLSIHEQYLNQQVSHTRYFFQWSQQQYAQLVTPAPTTAALPAHQTPQPPAFSEPFSTNGFVPATPTQPVASIAPSPALGIAQPPVVAPVTLDLAALGQKLLEVVSEKTGYPVEMLNLDMDMEADLGIDSIKRVEILGALQELYPDLPRPDPEALAELDLRTLGQVTEYIDNQATALSGDPALATVIATALPEEPFLESDPAPQPVAPSPALGIAQPPVVAPVTLDLAALGQKLLEVVSEKTGYPVEMLNLDMDMEADLGIDSIKRVEILGALQELYPDLPRPDPEALAELDLRTLGQVTEYIDNQALLPQPEATETQTQAQPQILRQEVRLRYLAEPDALEVSIPDQHVALLTDDGTALTGSLAQALHTCGWKVVVLSFPQTVGTAIPEAFPRVVLKGLEEQHLQAQLEAIQADHGPIGGFFHLHPASCAPSDQLYAEPEEALLKGVFFTAKHLKETLNKAALQGRSYFVTVAHLDGTFGLSHKTNYGALAGGLFGLTKSLHWEWQSVFCRALDLSPDLDIATSVEYILKELNDPNRLIAEVGYSEQGRTTLIC
ncbi:type I polyketide synthase [Anthocerotibacter panamensis]|uniref:type I polyketide synthase n=1 Tax=Anthocerotibacter panamensis TaxID=2857077 RepID=UPI001C40307D|nr:type I polyketide synthase [Anthocerotibacter panamensis]